MDNQILEQFDEDLKAEQMPKPEEGLTLPDPNYTPPMFLTSKRAKSQVRNQLYFLEKLTSI